MALTGDGQDGRRVFSLVEEDGRLVGGLELDLGRAWRALGRGWLTVLAAAAAAVHERLAESLEQGRMVSDIIYQAQTWRNTSFFGFFSRKN